MASDIKVYVDNYNPYGQCALKFFSDLGIPVKVCNVSQDSESRKEFLAMGYMGTPIIVIDGEEIVGFDRESIEDTLGIRRLPADAIVEPAVSTEADLKRLIKSSDGLTLSKISQEIEEEVEARRRSLMSSNQCYVDILVMSLATAVSRAEAMGLKYVAYGNRILVAYTNKKERKAIDTLKGFIIMESDGLSEAIQVSPSMVKKSAASCNEMELLWLQESVNSEVNRLRNKFRKVT